MKKIGKLHLLPNMDAQQGAAQILQRRIKIYDSRVDVEGNPVSDLGARSVIAPIKAYFTYANKRLRRTTVFDNLSNTRKYKCIVSIVDFPQEGWSINWAHSAGVIEINASGIARLNKSKAFATLCFALGVAYYDQCMLAPERKYWKLLMRKEGKVSLSIGRNLISGFTADILGKARFAWGLGWLSYCVTSKKLANSPLRDMVGEFLRDTSRDLTVTLDIDPENPLGDVLDPKRFQHFEGVLSRYAGQTYRIGNSHVDAKIMMDQAGSADYGNAIIEHLIHNQNKMVKVDDRNPPTMKSLKDIFGFNANSPIQDQIRKSIYIRSGTCNLELTSPNGITLCEVNRGMGGTQSNNLCKAHWAIQGAGLGMKMTVSQIATAMKTGQKKISVSAAGGPPPFRKGAYSGYCVWNKFGWEFSGSGGAGGVGTKSFRSFGTNSEKYWQASADKALSLLGEMDCLDIMKEVMLTKVLNYYGNAIKPDPTLLTQTDTETTPQPPPDPVFPEGVIKPATNSDVKDILFWVIDTWSSYSSALTRALRDAGLPTASNKSDIQRWLNMNVATEDQRRALRNYFLKQEGSGGSGSRFRSRYGYPPVQGSSSRRPTTRNAALSDMISSWGWVPALTLSFDSVSDFIKSQGFEMAFARQQFIELLGWLKAEGKMEYVTKYDLNPDQQRMQALMDVEIPHYDGSGNMLPFGKWWENHGSSFSGVMDLSDGAYSLPVLMIDQYRKKKAAKQLSQGRPNTFPRARTASTLAKRYLKIAEFDEDLFASDGIDEEEESIALTEGGGAFTREDLELVEEARAEAAKILKEMKKKSRDIVASRWLGIYRD